MHHSSRLKVSSSNFIYLALFLLLFVFVFGWKITNEIDLILISSILIILLFILRYSKIVLNRKEIVILICLIVMTLYGFIIAFARGLFDLSFITRSVRTVINTLAAFLLVRIYYDYSSECSSSMLLKHLESCILLHAVICILMYTIPSFGSYVYRLTNIIEWGATTSIELGYRTSGLTYGLSQTSVVQMWGILLIMYNQTIHKRSLFIYVCKNIVVLISILIVGRSGLLLGIFFIPIYYLLSNYKNQKQALKNVIVIMVVVVVIVSLWDLILSLLPEKFSSYTLFRAEEVFNFFAGEESSTMDVIANKMITIPENAIDFIFGTSSLGRSSEVYIQSDIGYIKVLFAVGIIGSLLTYLPVVLCLYYVTKSKRSVPLKSLTFIILCTNLILNFKELAIYTRNQWSIIAILVSVCIFLEKKERAN